MVVLGLPASHGVALTSHNAERQGVERRASAARRAMVLEVERHGDVPDLVAGTLAALSATTS